MAFAAVAESMVSLKLSEWRPHQDAAQRQKDERALGRAAKS